MYSANSLSYFCLGGRPLFKISSSPPPLPPPPTLILITYICKLLGIFRFKDENDYKEELINYIELNFFHILK